MLILWIIALLLIILLLIGFYFATRILYPHKRSHAETHQIEKESGFMDVPSWDNLTREEVWIESPYGYRLYGVYIPSVGSHKTVVFSHGIAYTLHGSIKYLHQFRKRGFNVVLYDHRNHGRSGGRNTTFGYYEKFDLRAVVDWAMRKQGGGGIVGVHGESLGGSVALQYAAIDDRCAFVVSDCPFSDLKDLLLYRLHYDYHLPGGLFLPLAGFFCTVLSGMSFDAVSPLRDIRTLQVPVLLIHGKEDRYVPPEMSQRLYEAKHQGIRQLYVAPEARHADTFVKNPVEYEHQVDKFLTRIGMNSNES